MSNLINKAINEEMKNRRNKKHWTNEDINNIRTARNNGDWHKIYESKLYNEHGGDYCELLYVIHILDNPEILHYAM